MRLLPREEKFYHLFLKQVEIISEASRLLLEGVLEHVDDLLPGQAQAHEIGAVENQHLVVAHAQHRSGTWPAPPADQALSEDSRRPLLALRLRESSLTGGSGPISSSI